MYRLVLVVPPLIAALLAFSVVLGWLLGWPELVRPWFGNATTKFNAAISVLALAAAALLGQDGRRRTAAWVCALFAGTVAALTLCQDLFGIDLGIDQLVVQDRESQGVLRYPGRMAPVTAASLLLTAIATVLAQSGTRLQQAASAWFAAAGLILTTTVFAAGALSRLDPLGLGRLTSIAPQTSAALFLLCCSIILTVWRARTDAAATTTSPLRRTLRWVVLGFALATGSLWSYVVWRDYDETQQRLIREAEADARLLQEHAERALDGADLLAAAIKWRLEGDPALPLSLTETGWRMLNTVSDKLPQVEGVIIVDAAGALHLHSRHRRPPDFNVADRAYFQAHQRGEQVFLGPIVIGRRSNKAIFTVSRRIDGPGGRFRGIVVVAVNVEYFSRLFAGYKDDSIAALFRTDGELLARHPLPPQSERLSIAQGPLITHHLPRAPSGVFVVRTLIDGKERLIAYRKLSHWPAVVTRGIDTASIVAGWDARLVRYTGLLALAWAALGVFCYLAFAAAGREEKTMAELRASRRQTEYLANHDVLTGLPNRRLLQDRMEQAVLGARRRGTILALMAIDLDGFKKVNDLLGHDAGDQVLKQAAHMIARCTRSVDTVARIGGDEFVVVMEMGARPDAEAELVARRVLAAFREPIRIDADRVEIGCSIGIAFFHPEEGGQSIQDTVKRADTALYEAKRRGKNTFVRDDDRDVAAAAV